MHNIIVVTCSGSLAVNFGVRCHNSCSGNAYNAATQLHRMNFKGRLHFPQFNNYNNLRPPNHDDDEIIFEAPYRGSASRVYWSM